MLYMSNHLNDIYSISVTNVTIPSAPAPASWGCRVGTHRHLQRVRNLHEVFEVLVGQHGGDEQDGVRALGARQKNLVWLDDELLRQQRRLWELPCPIYASSVDTLVAAPLLLPANSHAGTMQLSKRVETREPLRHTF